MRLHRRLGTASTTHTGVEGVELRFVGCDSTLVAVLLIVAQHIIIYMRPIVGLCLQHTLGIADRWREEAEINTHSHHTAVMTLHQL